MNKVYKLVWSKVRNCYVAVSELAKRHTKAPKSGVVGAISLENKISLDLNRGFVAGAFANGRTLMPVQNNEPFKITVAAIVKNEAENVSTWVQAARSCADEIVVVDTGSTDDTVKRFADYGIKCFHYDWNDDFAAAKNYMISLCHGDWIVLLDGDEWFREGCDVKKAIAKHHNNPVTKAIIADWICLDKDRNNTVMFSGGAVRAFRNQPDVRYFRKVHENLTINLENFAFEPEFKMYHTGYSGSVNRSKHERNLRIMRTMFDFDNGKVEYLTDWRYIEDTYAGLGEFDKALWAADKMISYGVQEYSASAWVTKFNVLFCMKAPMEEMKKQFEYCFKTVPSVSGFRFLASIYYFRNGLIAEGLDNYIEALRMLMGPQDKVAMEHTYWRMYMPEASALASTVYLQNKQFEASLYACKVCEQYCGQTDWTNEALADFRRVMNRTEEGLLGNISERVLPVLQFGKKAVLATAIASSLTVGMIGVSNPVFAACCNLNGVTTNKTTGSNSTVTGGQSNTASGCQSSVSGGSCNIASGCCSSVSGGGCNTASDFHSSVSGGYRNIASCCYASVSGGNFNTASGSHSSVSGGGCNTASGSHSSVSGGYRNTASCSYASVSGGELNIASGMCSSVSGGYCNLASGGASSVSGGECNTASGVRSSVSGGYRNTASCSYASVSGGERNTASGVRSSVSGGCGNIAGLYYSYVNASGLIVCVSPTCSSISADGTKITVGSCEYNLTKYTGINASVSGGYYNVASGCNSSVSGGEGNRALGSCSSVSGGTGNTVSGISSWIAGGCNGFAYANYSSVIGGGIAGVSTCANRALGSVAIGKCATTTKDYEVAIGSACAPVKIGGNLTVTGTQTVTDGTTSKTWADILSAGSYILPAATASELGGVKIGSNITNSNGTISLTKANVVAALGYTPPTADTNTTYSNMKAATASAAGAAGLVPAPAAGKQTAFLRGDGTWVVPTNTTYSNMTAATADAAGKAGLVPAPAKGAQNYVLHGDGTWKADANTTYAAMTAAEATAGTATAARSITPKVLGDYVKSQTNNKITNLTVSGKTITFTKGDGSTGTITTQDNNTTYTAGSGLTLSGTAFSVNANGAIASGNANPLKGDTVFTEVRPTADGSFVKKANSTAANLTALDTASKNAVKNISLNGSILTFTKGDNSTGTVTIPEGKTYKAGTGLELASDTFNVKADGNVVSGDTGVVTGGKVYDAITRMIQYDEGTNDTATLVGSSGTKLTNLKAGTLSKTSTDAVSGAQLYATNQNIAGFASDIKKNKDNISNLNTSVTAALESVSASSSLVDTLNNTKADASLNNLTAAGQRVISTAAANAVQEYMRNNSTAGTNSNPANTSLHTLNRNGAVNPVNMSLMSVNPAPADTNFVVYDDAQASQITLEGPVGTGTKITGLADGELSAASTDAVTGAQLYEVTQHFDDFQSALSSNNTSIANAQTDINKMKTANIQLESDVNTLKTEMETGFNVTIDGAKVKTVNPQDNYVDFVAGDGLKIEDDNGSVKFSLDAVALGGVSQEQLDKKADLTYVDEQLGLKADKDSVYTKDETDELLADKADVSYVNTEIGSVRTALNGKADKSSVYTKAETDGLLADKADVSYVDDGLALKADKDSVYTKLEADNLFVNQKAMEDALGKKADRDASNIDTAAWAEKLGTGEIESGNTGLVNGGTVYEAISRINGSDMIVADREAGAIRIAGNGKYDGYDVVDISKSDGTGRVMTGVITNPDDKSSVANVGYVEAVGQNIANAVNNQFDRMDSKVNRVGANAAALAALTPASFEGDEKWSLAASVGNYRDATAGAIGAFYKPTENVMMNVRGSFGNSESMVAAGVAVALNKGDIPGVTKRQLAKAVNAQATEIQNMKQAYATEIQDMKQTYENRLANQADEIAELKAMVQQLAAKQKG